MPQAIGAQASQPGRQVISLSGDGGFTMLMGDLITLTQMKLPVKVVVFNNGVLGFVALEMKAAGFVDTNVDLENPDFAAMARAMGIFAQARRGSRRAPRRYEGNAGAQRAGAARRRHRQAGAVDAADHHAGADQGLQPLGPACGDERSRRRGARPRRRQTSCRASSAWPTAAAAARGGAGSAASAARCRSARPERSRARSGSAAAPSAR